MISITCRWSSRAIWNWSSRPLIAAPTCHEPSGPGYGGCSTVPKQPRNTLPRSRSGLLAFARAQHIHGGDRLRHRFVGGRSRRGFCGGQSAKRRGRLRLKGRMALHAAQAAANASQGGSAIVNTGSIAGLAGLPTSSAYVAAKHGVVGPTKTAAPRIRRRQHPGKLPSAPGLSAPA